MNKDIIHIESDPNLNEKDSSTPKGSILFKRIFESDSEVGKIHFLITYEKKWIKPTRILILLKKKVTKQKASKVKVSLFLKLWIENNWPDFQSNLKKRKFANLFQELMNLISTTRFCNEIQTLIEIREQTPIPSIIPIKQDGTLLVKDFTEIWFQNSDQKLSEFLTYLESRYWKAIENGEWLSSNWTKENKYVLAPHIMLSIDFSNYLTGFVHTSILSLDQVGDRVLILKRWVCIAKILFDLGNYSTATTIVFALNTSFITRLTKTLDQFKLLQTYSELESLSLSLNVSNLMKMYEKYLNTYPNCLPSLCVLTKKIATLHEMIKDDIQNGVIDFENRNLLGAVLYQIRQWQIHSFQLNQEDPNLMENFFNLQVLTDDQKRELSRQIEPPSPLYSPSGQSKLEHYKKRASRRIKEKIAKLPLQSINESLPVSHTSAPLSPVAPLTDSGSDEENQSPEKNRKNLKRLQTNFPTSPRTVTFADGIKTDSPLVSPNSPRIKERIDSPLSSPRFKERTLTHKGKIESSRELHAAPLERIVSPRRSWNELPSYSGDL